MSVIMILRRRRNDGWALKHPEIKPERVIRSHERRDQKHQGQQFGLLPCAGNDFILTEKSRKEWNSRQRGAADQHQNARLRQNPFQSRHFSHVQLAHHRVHHYAAAQKEQRLEKRVRNEMENTPATGRGQCTDADKHEAEL